MCEKRKVEIHSHGHFSTGWLVGYSKKDDVIYAVVETKGGSITCYEQPGIFDIRARPIWKEEE